MARTVRKFRLTRTGIVVINVQQAAAAAATATAAAAAAASSCVHKLSVAL
jgi:hypothetical protein